MKSVNGRCEGRASQLQRAYVALPTRAIKNLKPQAREEFAKGAKHCTKLFLLCARSKALRLTTVQKPAQLPHTPRVRGGLQFVPERITRLLACSSPLPLQSHFVSTFAEMRHQKLSTGATSGGG